MNSRFLPSLAALALAASGHASAALLAHWSFDSDFTDSTPNNNDLLTGAGTPTITTAAGDFVFGGGASDMDGSTWLATTSTISFAASDAWSVSFWGKRRVGSDNRSGMVVGTDGGTSEFIWTPNNPSVVEGMRVRNAGGASADYDGFADDNQFHHWVVIANGLGSVEVYRDNSSLGSQALTTTFSIDAVGTGAGAANIYNGQIDELYIFDEAIDSATVGSLFTSNSIPEPSSALLVALGGLAAALRRRHL